MRPIDADALERRIKGSYLTDFEKAALLCFLKDTRTLTIEQMKEIQGDPMTLLGAPKMTIEHKGYTAQQARNHHIMIFDQDGKMVSHVNCSHPLTEEEMKRQVDEILEIMEKFSNK